MSLRMPGFVALFLAAANLPAHADVATHLAPGGGTYVATLKSSCGDCVQYTSFAGHSFELRRLSGHYVEWLYPATPTPPRRANPAALARAVDMADLVYATFAQWQHAEPAGEGKTTIAVIPAPDEAAVGRGRIGHKGIELYLIGDGNLDDLDTSAASGRFDGLLVHEMAHNFDLADRITPQTSDPVHFWIGVLPRIYDVYHGWTFADIAPPGQHQALLRTMSDTIRRYGLERLRWQVETSGRSVASCILQGGCAGLATPNAMAAAIVFRAAQMRSPDFLPRYFVEVRAVAAARNDAALGSESLDAQLVALSRASGENLLCLAPALGWTASAGYSAQIAAAGLPRAHDCDDADGDGAVAFLDPDDTQATAKFGADEAVDGIDNDGDGIVDEIEVTAEAYRLQPSTRYPVAISGSLHAHGTADFILPALPTDRAHVELCTSAIFEMSAWLTRGRAALGNGVAAGGEGTSRRQCLHEEVRLAPGTQDSPVRLKVESFGETAAGYRLTVSSLPAVELQPASLAIDRVLLDGADTLRYRRFGTAPVPANTRARLWIAGRGFVLEQPADQGRFIVPAEFAAATLSARVQLVAGDVPVVPTSDLLVLPAPTATRSFDDFTGGVFGDPARRGEGWQLATGRIDGQRVLFIAFYAQLIQTDDATQARAPWFFGVTPFPAGRDHVDLVLWTSAAGTGGFASNNGEPFPALAASLTRHADGRLYATAIAGNGETSQGLLQPTVTAATQPQPMAGVWTAPGIAAEGLFVQATGADGLIVAWYGYCGTLASDTAHCGTRPHWLVGTGTATDGKTEIDLYEAIGNEFGVLQEPTYTHTTLRGHATLQRQGCDRLQLTYRDPHAPPVDATLTRAALLDEAAGCASSP